MNFRKEPGASKAPIGNWQLAIGNEFPSGASEWPNDLSRRDFLRLTTASLALAGLGACTKQPIEKIVPYAKQPPEVVPGTRLHFATATTFQGYAQGIIVTSREG